MRRNMLSPALKTACRIAFFAGFFLVLDYFYGQRMIAAMLPGLGWELHWLDDNYRILQLSLAAQDGDSVIRLDASLARFVVVGPHVIAPDARGHAVVTTLASSVLRPAIIGLTLLFSWPAQRALQHVWRLGIGGLLLAVLMALDVPLVLLGELWELLRAAQAPGSFSLLIIWKDFLQGGGRLALALCAVMVAIAMAQKFALPTVFCSESRD